MKFKSALLCVLTFLVLSCANLTNAQPPRGFNHLLPSLPASVTLLTQSSLDHLAQTAEKLFKFLILKQNSTFDIKPATRVKTQPSPEPEIEATSEKPAYTELEKKQILKEIYNLKKAQIFTQKAKSTDKLPHLVLNQFFHQIKTKLENGEDIDVEELNFHASPTKHAAATESNPFRSSYPLIWKPEPAQNEPSTAPAIQTRSTGETASAAPETENSAAQTSENQNVAAQNTPTPQSNSQSALVTKTPTANTSTPTSDTSAAHTPAPTNKNTTKKSPKITEDTARQHTTAQSDLASTTTDSQDLTTDTMATTKRGQQNPAAQKTVHNNPKSSTKNLAAQKNLNTAAQKKSAPTPPRANKAAQNNNAKKNQAATAAQNQEFSDDQLLSNLLNEAQNPFCFNPDHNFTAANQDPAIIPSNPANAANQTQTVRADGLQSAPGSQNSLTSQPRGRSRTVPLSMEENTGLLAVQYDPIPTDDTSAAANSLNTTTTSNTAAAQNDQNTATASTDNIPAYTNTAQTTPAQTAPNSPALDATHAPSAIPSVHKNIGTQNSVNTGRNITGPIFSVPDTADPREAVHYTSSGNPLPKETLSSTTSRSSSPLKITPEDLLSYNPDPNQSALVTTTGSGLGLATNQSYNLNDDQLLADILGNAKNQPLYSNSHLGRLGNLDLTKTQSIMLNPAEINQAQLPNAVTAGKQGEHTPEENKFKQPELSAFQQELNANPNVFILEQKDDKAGQNINTVMLDRIKTSANYIKSFIDADDREEYLKNQAYSYAQSQIESGTQNFLKSFDGLKTEVNLGLNLDKGTFDPSGKILIPFYNSINNTTFFQTGLTHSYNSRKIVHAALGTRYFPEATSFDDPGSYMVGGNVVYDVDITRGHQRFSLGLEYVNKWVKLAANFYRRLTGWTATHETNFDRDLVQERVVSGFDLRSTWMLPRTDIGHFNIKADVTHWLGKNVSPYGSTSPDQFEDNPWIYAIGLEYKPVPALGFEAREEITGKGKKNSYIGLKFDIPLSNALYDAFTPDGFKSFNPNDLRQARFDFINRDYKMPLQYRTTPGAYDISYCGKQDLYTHCFLLTDGFKQPATAINVNITPQDNCIKFSSDGNYITDNTGHIYGTIYESCKLTTTVTVKAEQTKKDFDLDVGFTNLYLTADPEEITKAQTSKLTFTATSQSQGADVKWSVKGKGSISQSQKSLSSEGTATAIYNPVNTVTSNYTSEVRVTYNGTVFKQPITVTTYGVDSELTIDTDSSDQIEDGVYEAGKIIKIVIPGLRPGSKVVWVIEGDGDLSVNSDGSDPAKTITTVVDDNGNATAYVIGDDVDEGHIKIIATSEDDPDNPKTIEFDIKSYVPTYTWEPNPLEPHDDFTLTLSALKKDTEVGWSDGDYANAQTLTTTVENDGTTVATYTVVGNLYPSSSGLLGATRGLLGAANTNTSTDDNAVTEVKGIEATYYRNAKVPHAVLAIDPLPLHQYTFNPGDDITTDIPNPFHPDDEGTITIIHGKPGETVKVTIEGDGVLIHDDEQVKTYTTTFDENGEAVIEFKSVPPYEEDIKIIIETMGQKIEYDIEVLDDWTLPDPGDDPTGIINIQVQNPITGENEEPNTIDYKTEYTVDLSPLKPGTETIITIDNVQGGSDGDVTFDNGQTTVTCMVTNEKTCTFTLDGVENFDVTSFDLTIDYAKSSTERDTVGPITIKMIEYTLSFSTTAITDFSGLDTEEVTLTGGRPSEDATFTISGDGKITTAEATFDNQGEAKVTIQGKDPYTSQIVLTGSGVGKSATFQQSFTSWELNFETVNYPETTGYASTADTFNYETEGQVINLTGGKPNTDVTFEILDNPNVTLASNTCHLSNTGTCTITLNPVTTYVLAGQTFNLKATYNYVTGVTTTKTKQYSLYSYNLEFDDPASVFKMNTASTFKLKGGRAGSSVTFSKVSGDGTLSDTATQFNSSGEATFTIAAASPYGAAIIIQADTMGTSLQFTQNYTEWAANFVSFQTTNSTTSEQATNTVDYSTPQVVNIENARPGSTVTFSTNNSTAVTLTGASCTVAADGTCQVTINGITDYSVSEFTLKANYLRLADPETYGEIAQVIKLYTYNPYFTTEPSTTFNGADTLEITLKGGRNGDDLQFKITSGHGQFTNSSDTYSTQFSGDTAAATIQGVADYENTIVVTAYAMGKTPTFSQEFHNWTATIHTDPAIHPITGTQYPDTMDYDYDGQTVDIYNGMPGTKVKFEFSDNVTSITDNTEQECTLDEDGYCNVTLAAITDYTVKNFTITATYYKNQSVQLTAQKTLTMMNYPLTVVTQSQDLFTGNDTIEIEVEGGRPGASLNYKVTSGDGEIVGQTSEEDGLTVEFDSTGIARATLTGKSPYNDQITVTMTGLDQTKTFTQALTNYDSFIIDDFNTTNATYGNSADNTVDYSTTQVISFSNGMPNTWVTPKAFVGGSESNAIIFSPEKCEIGSDGTCSVTLQGITDYSIESFTLNAIHARNSAELDEDEEKTINLYSYTLHMDSTATENFSGIDTKDVQVSGGQKNAPVNFTVTTGDGTFLAANTDTAFGNDGTAVGRLQGISDYQNDIEIQVTGMGQTVTLTQPMKNWELAFDNKTRIPYDSPNTISFTGGMPGDVITFTRSVNEGTAPDLSSATCTVATDGTCEVTIATISDRATTEFTLDVEYHSNSAVTATESTHTLSRTYEVYEPIIFTPQGDGAVTDTTPDPTARAVKYVTATGTSTFVLAADTANSLTVIWDCDNGSTTTTSSYSSNTSTSMSCSWSTIGDKTITATVASGTYTWKVNVYIEYTKGTAPTTLVLSNGTVTGTFYVTASGNSNEVPTWSCDSSSGCSLTSQSNFNGGTSASATFTFTESGTKTITITTSNASSTYSLSVVKNSYSKTSGSTSLSGSSLSATYKISASYTNSNSVTWSCGSGGAASGKTSFSNGTSAQATCSWTTEGTKTVSATVSDSSGTNTSISWSVSVTLWSGGALTWSSSVITGDTYSSNTGASASNKYRVAKSTKSNGYYIITEENYQAKVDKYIFVAATVLSGSSSGSGAEWGGYNTTGASGATGTAVGTSKSNTDIIISANLSPYTSGKTVAGKWVRATPQCPTTFNGVESAGNCDLPSKDTLYTIWQVRASLPQVSGATVAANSWPRGYGGSAVWSSTYYSNSNAYTVNDNGYEYAANKLGLGGVLAVREIGY